MRSGAIGKYWPATQSLDLVEGSIEDVARAVETEVRRFTHPEPIEAEWRMFGALGDAFAACRLFTNVPTFYLVLPTHSRWTVLWNNSFLCDGYDSLCHCITQNHGLTTMHWAAHDQSTTFQPGSRFTFRALKADTLVERSVYCGREDKRWLFEQIGQPLPEEDTSAYGAKQKKDRLNESGMLALLERLGAKPWNEEFYRLGIDRCFVMNRRSFPPSISRRLPQEVLFAG